MEYHLTESYIKVAAEEDKPEFLTIVDCLEYYAKTKAEREAIIFVSTDGKRQSVTWSELYERSQAAARSFVHLGLKKQEIVALNIRTCPEWLYASFGAMMAGAITFSISFTYMDGSDLIALMENLQTCSLLVMDPGLDDINWNILRQFLDELNADGRVRSEKMPYLRYLVGVAFDHVDDQVLKFSDLLQENHADIVLPKLDQKDTTLLFQTSGSTGVPKLVALTHEPRIKGITGKHVEHMDAQYKLFNDRPFTWSGGYPFSVVTGQTRVTVSGFCKPPEDRISFLIETIAREKCTAMFALPPMMHELIKRQNELPSNWPVIVIMSGGQPMTKKIASCIGKSCKFLLCLYASTEFLALAKAKISHPEEFTEYSCGKPIQYPGLEIKIVDEDGKVVPINTQGEIYCRSPVMFKEYFNDPVRTKAAKSGDGWFRPDDIGRMTRSGELFVEGRKSNMIISGGFSVTPEILEQVMKNFPGVESVAIVPVPDDIYYQILCACVVKKAGSDVTEEELRACCANFHADKPGLFTVLPRHYLFLERFPETSTGKLNRRELEKIVVQHIKPAS